LEYVRNSARVSGVRAAIIWSRHDRCRFMVITYATGGRSHHHGETLHGAGMVFATARMAALSIFTSLKSSAA